MKFGKLTVIDKITGDDLDTEDQNVMLNAFRNSVNNSLTLQNMIDGFIDEYEDETGVNTGSSTNQFHDTADNFYRPVLDSNTRLLLHLNGEEGDTDTTDFSTFAHTPIVFNVNAKLTTSDKQVGSASLDLDGTTGTSLEVGDTSDFKFLHGAEDTSGFTFTIEAWIKLPPGRPRADLFYTKTAGSNPVGIESWIASDGTIRLDISHGVGGQNIVTNGTSPVIYPDDNAWHHLAFTYDHSLSSDNLKIWLDGVQEDQATKSGNTPSTANSARPFRIGQREDGAETPTNNADALIDEVRVSDIVRYTSSFTPPSTGHSTAENMTLLANSVTAEAQPDIVRISLFEEEVEVLTLNTDLKISVSRDGGTTFTQATLASEGKYRGIKRILTAEVDISSQPAGTSMVYKIETANNKEAVIHGTSLTWD